MTHYARRIKYTGTRNGIAVYRITLHEQWQCSCGAAYLDDCKCFPPVLHGTEVQGNTSGFIQDYADQWQTIIEAALPV